MIRSTPVCGQTLRRTLAAIAATFLGTLPSRAQFTNLADLSIEQLVDLEITSVSKRPERLGDAAAAIAVLTRDDLHRTGVTSFAEALRFVPGMHVGTINSSTWAVSTRGFADQYANKLLVLVDGRSVYSPLFSGTYWDVQQLMMEDVDRVEVIRGPGATVWGANAVNGVINIVSASARQTQGTVAYAGGGTRHRTMAGLRHGGTLGENTYYRVYATEQSDDDLPDADGRRGHDRWRTTQGGFRMDHDRGDGAHLTWQGDIYGGDRDHGASDVRGSNTLGRWTQTFSERSSFEVQAYLDHTYRRDLLAEVRQDTADLSVQHTFAGGERHHAIWGAGYRRTVTKSASTTPAIVIRDDHVPLQLFSAFIQDEIALQPDILALTVGTKIEHNELTGIEVQPTARVAYKPAENQTVWGAVSRAVRTPAIYEGEVLGEYTLGAPFMGPDGGIYLPTLVANRDAKSEVLWAYEAGYRIQADDRVSVDLTAFYNDYHGLLAYQPSGIFSPGVPFGIAEFQFRNTQQGEVYGGEAALAVQATGTWRLSAGFSLQQIQMHDHAVDAATTWERETPARHAFVRSSSDFGRRVSLDAQVRYVSSGLDISSYVTADLHLSYRLTDELECSLVGQNLLHRQHAEQLDGIGFADAEIPRSFHGKLTWRF